jgi:tetratricopeptide (TPR) repeat protein
MAQERERRFLFCQFPRANSPGPGKHYRVSLVKDLPFPVYFEAMLKQASVIVALVLLLGGCATTPVPEQVPSRSRAEPPVTTAGRYQPPEITAYREPAVPDYTRPAPGRAVQALMARAERQTDSGELVAAASSLERALRIEPKNAELWNRLAHLRYRQKQYSLAASLAAKSNALAGSDGALRADNNDLIRRARSL